MTSLFSFAFLAFFLPLVVVLYSATPRRFRWIVLLVASYAFFWAISGQLIAYLLVSTITVYLVGLGMQALTTASRTERAKVEGKARKQVDRRYTHRKRALLAVGLAINFGLLAACKYLLFAEAVAKSLLQVLGIELTLTLPTLAAPIGISFYTLMAASYLIDVSRGAVEADRNLGRVALFLCFFPQIVEGPICRYKDTTSRLMEGRPVTSQNLFAGSLRILWGLAKKLIVADRLNAFVKPVFDNPSSYDGGVIAMGAILYTLQLYCDFSGAIDVALGTARIFDVRLPENFRQPFFSRTASEFWQRWHITLGTWFRDYIYYPISLSRPMKRLTSRARKKLGNRYGPLIASSVALFAVWFGNGLWHGAGSQYIFFGLYYFVIILAGNMIEPLAQKAAGTLGVDRNGIAYRTMQIMRTLVVIVVGELFFRANGLATGLSMFWRMITGFTFTSFTNGTMLSLGMDVGDFVVIGISVVALVCVGIVKERGMVPLDRISAAPFVQRWALWLSLAMIVVIFGAYGIGYTPVDPIYAQF